MNNNNYITYKLWDESISLHRDFVKSTILSNILDDISHIMNRVAYELLIDNNTLSTIAITIYQDGKFVKNNDMTVLYVQRMRLYRTLVREILTFISDCYEYKIEEDECDVLQKILFPEKRDSERYLITPSLLHTMCDYLEINERVLFKYYSNVEELLRHVLNNCENYTEHLIGTKFTSTSVVDNKYNMSPISMKLYFKVNHDMNFTLTCPGYNGYLGSILPISKNNDYSNKLLFYNLYHCYNLSLNCIVKLRIK